MTKLYIFNPENDLALAADVDRYTAPALVRRLRADLSVLPLWIAEPGSRILAERNPDNLDFVAECCRSHILPADVALYDGGQLRPMPWGWSRSVRNEFERAGIAVDVDDAMLAEFRALSSRRTTVEMLRLLAAGGVDVPPMPVICSSVAEAEAAVSRFSAAVVKMPWSSSGRGVCRVSHDNFPQYANWIGGIIRRQGEALCEPYLDKVQDFAMEYYVADGEAAFKGYSVFFNNQQMSYDHALVASTARLRRRLSLLIGDVRLDDVRQSTAAVLRLLLPRGFEGYVGVDMMAYRDSVGTLRVNPCVEVNLRTTMGVVSASLGDRVLHPDCEAVMRVLYHKNTAALEAFMQTLQPPHIAGGRLCGGTMLLAPVSSQSRYTATLTVS